MNLPIKLFIGAMLLIFIIGTTWGLASRPGSDRIQEFKAVMEVRAARAAEIKIELDEEAAIKVVYDKCLKLKAEFAKELETRRNDNDPFHTSKEEIPELLKSIAEIDSQLVDMDRAAKERNLTKQIREIKAEMAERMAHDQVISRNRLPDLGFYEKAGVQIAELERQIRDFKSEELKKNLEKRSNETGK